MGAGEGNKRDFLKTLSEAGIKLRDLTARAINKKELFLADFFMDSVDLIDY